MLRPISPWLCYIKKEEKLNFSEPRFDHLTPPALEISPCPTPALNF